MMSVLPRHAQAIAGAQKMKGCRDQLMFYPEPEATLLGHPVEDDVMSLQDLIGIEPTKLNGEATRCAPSSHPIPSHAIPSHPIPSNIPSPVVDTCPVG